jgi:hypothetical protein
MTANHMIEERVIERAMRSYPTIEQLVVGSTPVVSFGNPGPAKMITIGINPSRSEFQVSGKSKNLLPVEKKRLVDLETLGIKNPRSLNREQAIRVIQGCYEYFDTSSHNPYMTWFNLLNENINKHFGLDYLDGSAAHLDLVQWATDPVWGGIDSEATKDELLKSDAEFLRYQVGAKKYDIVFMNGREVKDQLEGTGIVEVTKVKNTSYRTSTKKTLPLEFFRGSTSNGSLVLGWSKPFPGHYIWSESLPAVVQELHQFMDEQTR